MRRFLISLVFVLSAFVPGDSFAGVQSCSASAVTVAFGNYDVLSAPQLDTSSLINLTCSCQGKTNNTNVTLTISAGNSGNVNQRQMLSGANVMNYNLYRDAARTIVWDNTTGKSCTASSSTPCNPCPCVLSCPETLNVYGRVSSGQTTLPAGSYDDPVSPATMTLTITY